MSWVFLGADSVLKLKKPGSTGFQDFSTPAAQVQRPARRAACGASVVFETRRAVLGRLASVGIDPVSDADFRFGLGH